MIFLPYDIRLSECVKGGAMFQHSRKARLQWSSFEAVQ